MKMIEKRMVVVYYPKDRPIAKFEASSEKQAKLKAWRIYEEMLDWSRQKWFKTPEQYRKMKKDFMKYAVVEFAQG
jgi:hypothetical protein